MIRIGLPKGRLQTEVASPVFEWLGVPSGDGDRRATADYELLLLKPRDLVQALRLAVVDVAAIPHEWILEDFSAQERDDLRVVRFVPRCRVDVSWLFPRDRLNLREALRSSGTIVTSFQLLARAAAEKMGLRPALMTFTGSVEAVVASQNVVGLDIVESGRTAAVHGLATEPLLRTEGIALTVRGADSGTGRAVRDLQIALEVQHRGY